MNDESSRREEQRGLRELLGLPEPAHRDVHEPPLAPRRVGQELREQRRLDRPRAQGVAPDALARVLDRDLARHRRARRPCDAV